MKNAVVHFLSLTLVLLLAACGETNNDPNAKSGEISNAENLSDVYEQYVYDIDGKEMMMGNSLYYTRDDGATVEVDIYVNDSNQVVKTAEYYTKQAGGSICTNLYYYKGDKKYVTKAYYEEGLGENAIFIEEVTYYDEAGNPLQTQMRKASFEDQLINEQFKTITAKDHSDARAVQVLNQQGEFATDFQFFVNDEHLLYLVVGENKDGGYRSSLVVQRKGPVIQKLLANESSMVGTPLKVDFETMKGDMGFEFQALLDIEFAQ